jgi:YegS/Rv2252/BmrU family lipid kinase
VEDDNAIGIIINPASAGGRTLRLAPEITDLFAASGRRHDVHISSKAGEPPVVARQMLERGLKTIVAVGGDGTINEVGSAILEHGGDAALGIIPSGSGSDFVRTLKLPKRIASAVQIVLNRHVTNIDAGRITFDDGSFHHFVNVAGLGFDAVVAEIAIETRLPGSTLPYIASALRAMRVYHNMMMRIESEHGVWEGRAASVLFANAQYFAGGMHIAPMANLTDGALDVCILGDLTHFEMIRALPGLFKGKHVTNPKFKHFTAKSITVSSEYPARVQADGELFKYTPVTIDVLPGALKICR